MADAPRPCPERDVIPLHPHRPAPRRLRLPQLPPEIAALLRESGRKALGFFAPALFLAAGATLLALLAGCVAGALGLRIPTAAALAVTAGEWTLLATAGGALARRGLRLAAVRWR
jgi:hypothetical protein